MYTSILLDLDNTLLDFNKAEKNAVKKVLSANGLPDGDDIAKAYSEINKSFWERFERGEIPKSEIYTGRFYRLLEFLGADGDAAALSREYGGYLSKGYFTVDGAFDILDYLKDKGYSLYAATNGISAVQYSRIEGSGLKPYFKAVFVSEDAGHQKPEKAYYDYVLANIPEKDIRKILIVGDSQSSDILGGINAGIDACWYNPAGGRPHYPSKYEIKVLSELKNIL